MISVLRSRRPHRVLLLGHLLLIGTTRCAPPVDGPERLTAEQVGGIVQRYYHTSGPLADSLRDDRPVPIYAPDQQDPWNRLHHLLFSRTIRRAMSPYFREGLTARLEARLVGAENDEQLLIEADAEEFLEGRSIVARILLQQDLWDRFELDSFVRLEQDVRLRAIAERLEALLGRAIARVSCRPEDLARVPSNLAAIAERHTIDADFLSPASDWREIVPFTSSSPARTTAHARNAGFRRVFRVFLRITPEAGGAQCLEEYFRRHDGIGSAGLPCFTSGFLAPASRAILVETLLALTRTGAIVHLPLIFSLQMREIRPIVPGADGRYALDDLPFFLYHGSRLLFVRSGISSGGLVAVPADAPVPAFVSAFQSSAGQPLVPARLSCPQCHGPTGQHLMTPAFHALQGIRVLRPGSTLQQEAVLRAKRERDDYRNLMRYFPGH